MYITFISNILFDFTFGHFFFQKSNFNKIFLKKTSLVKFSRVTEKINMKSHKT